MISKAKRTFCLSKHHHPSKSEAEYCNWLFARKQNREILDYKLYPSVPLTIAGKLWKFWKIDFQVFEKDGSVSFHESKGWNRSDDSFKLKRDAFLICNPNIKLFINKQLYTAAPLRKRLNWNISEVRRRNKRAAASRKRMRIARETGTIREWMK